MSYILDALRRADSERDRGAVPDLFAQPLPRVSVDADAALGSQRWLWVALGAALLALVGMVAWRLTAPAAPAAVVPAPAAAPAPVALPPVAVAPTTSPPTTSPPPTSTALPERSAVPARPVRKPARSEAPTADRLASVVASAPEPRLYARNELPAEVQRDLPTLAIGGASYSESPANRMLIINGQVFHEGDKLAPDLVLEQIKLKTAVLRYKNYRYGVSY